MALYKLEDFHPNYRDELWDGKDIKGADVFADNTDDKIGTVKNVLVDESGNFRYLLVDTGPLFTGKQVLLPIGRSRVDASRNRIYARGIANNQQLGALPEYQDSTHVNYQYEEQVRGFYRMPLVEESLPVEMSVPVETEFGVMQPNPPARPAMPQPIPEPAPAPRREVRQEVQPIPAPAPRREVRQEVAAPDTYSYEREPDLYAMNDQEHQSFRLYEERLMAHKQRQKTGEVVVNKYIETEMTEASVPVERERIVIEVNSAQGHSPEIVVNDSNFREGEIARMDVYEETADFRKEPVVREEINIRKEVVQDTVNAKETLRREELDIDRQGSPNMSDRPLDERNRR